MKQRLHFVEANENFSPYSAGRKHRHVPEMEIHLARACGRPCRVTFVPHLVPMDRGILTTIYARALGKAGPERVVEVWEEAYRDEPFVRVLRESLPETKWVTGTNLCLLGACEGAGGTVVLFSAIDNLIKGASGQAVQNFNLLFGIDETTAL